MPPGWYGAGGASRTRPTASAAVVASSANAAQIHRRRRPAGAAAHQRSPDQRVGRPEGDDRGDVPARQDVLEQRPRFLFADHVAAGAGRVGRVLVREVAIELDAADAVLVEEAVAVAVDAFPVHRPAAGLALLGVGALHQPRVVARRRERPARILGAHHRDHPVAVQILRRILVEAAVVVVVGRRQVAAARRLERREHRFRAVRVQPRHDVEDPGGELTADALVGRGEQRPRDAEGERAAGDLIRRQVGDQQDAGTRRRRGRARRGHLDRPQPPAAGRPPELDQRRRRRVRRGERLQFRFERILRQVAIGASRRRGRGGRGALPGGGGPARRSVESRSQRGDSEQNPGRGRLGGHHRRERISKMIRWLRRLALAVAVLAVALAVLRFAFGMRVYIDGDFHPHLAFGRQSAHYDALEAQRAAQRAASPAPAAGPATAPAAASATPPASATSGPVSAAAPSATAAIDAAAPAAAAPSTPPASDAGSWTDYRGPARDGVYRQRAIAATWPAGGPRLLWKQPIGEGHASFVVARGLAYTIEQRRDREVVAAYELATGRERWTVGWDALFSESMGGDGPRATPTYADGILYALGAAGELRALTRPNRCRRVAHQHPPRCRRQQPAVGHVGVAADRRRQGDRAAGRPRRVGGRLQCGDRLAGVEVARRPAGLRLADAGDAGRPPADRDHHRRARHRAVGRRRYAAVDLSMGHGQRHQRRAAHRGRSVTAVPFVGLRQGRRGDRDRARTAIGCGRRRCGSTRG